MAKKKSTAPSADVSAAQIISYRHADKRKNNPEVGIVTPATDPEAGKTRWAYDPHIDPALQFDPSRAAIEKLIDDALASGDQAEMAAALQELKRQQSPYLNWAGKAERTSFDIDTVSLHVHERVDPASILAAVRKVMKGEGKVKGVSPAIQPGLFDAPFENVPLREAIDFYRHERGWANRLVSGDSLLVMNSLLQKESMAGKVQMIYIDPPYGIKYGSNFQPFTNKREVTDRKDEDLTQEPEMIKAFRDTWELGIHSYLTYLRDRLTVARDLLADSGSIFVQIGDENVHRVRAVMDEVFGDGNCVSLISYKTTQSAGAVTLDSSCDYILWYCRNRENVRFNNPLKVLERGEKGATRYNFGENTKTGEVIRVASDEDEDQLGPEWRFFTDQGLTSRGDGSENTMRAISFQNQSFLPPAGHWRTSAALIEKRLIPAGRVIRAGKTIRFKKCFDDFGCVSLTNLWDDVGGGIQSRNDPKIYVVQTSTTIIQRCLLMATHPGDLVLDPTCGGGTTAFVAEKWGRRWITCDTSRVAVTLAKQRLMTASYDYYALRCKRSTTPNLVA